LRSHAFFSAQPGSMAEAQWVAGAGLPPAEVSGWPSRPLWSRRVTNATVRPRKRGRCDAARVARPCVTSEPTLNPVPEPTRRPHRGPVCPLSVEGVFPKSGPTARTRRPRGPSRVGLGVPHVFPIPHVPAGPSVGVVRCLLECTPGDHYLLLHDSLSRAHQKGYFTCRPFMIFFGPVPLSYLMLLFIPTSHILWDVLTANPANYKRIQPGVLWEPYRERKP